MIGIAVRSEHPGFEPAKQGPLAGLVVDRGGGPKARHGLRPGVMSVYRLHILAGSDAPVAELKASDDAAARAGAREMLVQMKEAAGAVLWRIDQGRRNLVRIGIVPAAGTHA
jgi:hypothetical protein